MTVLMFPGQGSQTRGMGRDLFDRFPELVAQADAILGYSTRALCLEDPRKELNDTRFTQPALYLVNALSLRAWRADNPGVALRAVLGHSLGEYNALEAAGVLAFEDGLRLVQKRGALMGAAAPGAMAAVIGPDEATIRARLTQAGLECVDIANLNGPSQTILSGLKEDVAKAMPLFEGEGMRCVPLNTSGAFHSRHMAPARAEFTDFLAGVTLSTPSLPVIANVTARPYETASLAETLAAQITSPVNWIGSIRHLMAAGETVFIEVGPGQVLTRLAKDIQAAPLPPEEAAPAPASSASTSADAPSRVEAWNRTNPVGTRVTVSRYPGVLSTRTPAMTLFGHRAAVYLDGYNGYFELADLTLAG